MDRIISSRFSNLSQNSSRTTNSYDVGSEACSTRLSSRLNTSASDNGRNPSVQQLKISSNILFGEAVKASPIRSLSALYRPNYKSFPTFPSIYETKYQRDFQYIPFPISKGYKENPAPSNLRGFKFGNTTNEVTFTKHTNQHQRNQVYVNSINRRHKPHPKISLAQNYPNQFQWIWSDRNSAAVRGHLHSLDKREDENLKMHRWNSR